jgi:hypothetical protein
MTVPALLYAALGIFVAHDPAGSHDPSGHRHGVDDQDWQRAPRSEVPVYVGEGSNRYLWDSDWMKLPEGREWLGSTHGCIVVDATDRVYLSADSGPAMLVFAPDGTLERSFGEEWGPGLHGITIVKERGEIGAGDETRVGRELLYLAHTTRQEVLKTTLKGEVLMRIGLPTESQKYEDPTQYKPTSVAVAPGGEIYVADGYGLSWIHRFDEHGAYLTSFGGRGDQPRHLATPHGLWLDTRGAQPTLLVADRENHRLARFSLTGEFLSGTDPSSGLLRRPCHVQFLGGVAVVADLAGRTTLLNDRLELITHLGDNPDTGQWAQYGVTPDLWREGIFFAPHCARFNSQGELFVMDWNVAGRVTRLIPAPQGQKGD